MDEKYKQIGDPADRVVEECAEVIKEICKAQRFGWENVNPKDSSREPSYKRILREINYLDFQMTELIKWIDRKFITGD